MSYVALYRKYRPHKFAQVFGQGGTVEALRNQARTGRIAHAYLFCGPRGTGKTSIAKIFARAINCEAPLEGEPCLKCAACMDADGTSLDIIEIDAASNNSVDRIREMIDNINYLPAFGKKRVYIIDEVHMLSASAFNAFLKTLEEPPQHVVFILATTEPHKLPATVLSRCQRFEFKRIGEEDIRACLRYILDSENARAEDEALVAIAKACDGGMRDSISLLDQCLAIAGEGSVDAKLVYDMLGSADTGFYERMAQCLLNADAPGAIGELDGFLNNGGDLRVFCRDMSSHLRDLYMKDGGSASLLYIMELFAQTESALRYSQNSRVLVELIIFKATRVPKENDTGALIRRVERLEGELSALKLGAARPAQKPRDEDIYADVPLPMEAPPPESEEIMLPFAEESHDSPTREREIAPPANEPKAAETQEKPKKSAAPTDPKRLWESICKSASPRLKAELAMGKATGISDTELFISFPQEATATAQSFMSGRRKEELLALIEKCAGRLTANITVEQYSGAEMEMMRESMKALPADITEIR